MKLAALAALVMLVASCCPCRKHRKGDSKPFVGTEWQLVQLNGRAVPVEGDLFTVVFGEDGRLSGLGACNRLMGSDVLSRFGPGAGFQRRFVRSDPLRSGRRYADASYRRRAAGCFAGQIAGLCGFCDGGTFRGSSAGIYRELYFLFCPLFRSSGFSFRFYYSIV